MNNNFIPVRIVKNCTMELNAGAEIVFPLLCPVREIEWIDGWKEQCQFIYTKSGIAEEGCVFGTSFPGEGEVLFICSKYDLQNTEIEYIKVMNGQVIVKWTMKVNNTTENKSQISVKYEATSLSEEGNTAINWLMDKRFPILMKDIEDNINYYVATGKMRKR